MTRAAERDNVLRIVRASVCLRYDVMGYQLVLAGMARDTAPFVPMEDVLPVVTLHFDPPFFLRRRRMAFSFCAANEKIRGGRIRVCEAQKISGNYEAESIYCQLIEAALTARR
jgi:hypothetical protein